MRKYRVLKVIGDGSFGRVLKCQNIETGEVVAIKKMKQKYHSWQECLKLREVQCLINLRTGNRTHENVVQLKSLFREFNELHFVFEFMEGDLYQMMMKQKASGKLFTEDSIREIMKQTILGLKYMHEKGYFHRDMKPENLLLKYLSTDNIVVKIADFGLAREIRSRPPFTQYVSTRWYRAPEVLLKQRNYSYPIDIFACGVIMAELYTLRPLFPGKNEYDELYKLCSTLGTPTKIEWENGYKLARNHGFKFPDFKPVPLDRIVTNASKEAIDLMMSMMRWNPQKRITISKALNHPFFQSKKPISIPHFSSRELTNRQRDKSGYTFSISKKVKKKKSKEKKISDNSNSNNSSWVNQNQSSDGITKKSSSKSEVSSIKKEKSIKKEIITKKSAHVRRKKRSDFDSGYGVSGNSFNSPTKKKKQIPSPPSYMKPKVNYIKEREKLLNLGVGKYKPPSLKKPSSIKRKKHKFGIMDNSSPYSDFLGSAFSTPSHSKTTYVPSIRKKREKFNQGYILRKKMNNFSNNMKIIEDNTPNIIPKRTKKFSFEKTPQIIKNNAGDEGLITRQPVRSKTRFIRRKYGKIKR